MTKSLFAICAHHTRNIGERRGGRGEKGKIMGGGGGEEIRAENV